MQQPHTQTYTHTQSAVSRGSWCWGLDIKLAGGYPFLQDPCNTFWVGERVRQQTMKIRQQCNN